MFLAEWKAVGCKLGSHTCSAAEFGVVASPQGQPGTGVKALLFVGAAEGPQPGEPLRAAAGTWRHSTGQLFFLKKQKGYRSHPRTSPSVVAGV